MNIRKNVIYIGSASGAGSGSQDTGINNFNDKASLKSEPPPVLPTSSLLVEQPSGSGGSGNQTQDLKNGHKLLEEEIWFHGVLPRLEVVRLLQEDGDFLVRETVRNEEKQIGKANF